MPQMSPLLWTMTIIMTINLLIFISSFLYFLSSPSSYYISYFHPYNNFSDLKFNWLW